MEDDGILQNVEKEEIGKEMNQDMEETHPGKVPMQGTDNAQNDSGIVEYTDLEQGGDKQPHESSDSDKDQTTGDLMHKNIEEHQLTIVGPTNLGWIQVKPKKGKKAELRLETHVSI